MNSMESMSFLKSKLGKNPIFGQDKLEDKLEDKIDFVQERTTYNPKRV